MADPSVAAAGAVAKATDETAAEAGKVAGNLLMRLLGPSADVVGADWAEKLRQRNLATLLRKTDKRAEREGAEDPGHATPRLAASTFEIAQYSDDEIISEYLSGALASSRAPGGGDDSGMPWSATISRMSRHQLRLHYLIYASTRSSLIALEKERTNELHQTDVMLATADVIARMGLNTTTWHRFTDAIDGLLREDLIDDTWGYAIGPLDHLAKQQRQYGAELTADFPSGIRVAISVHGIRLFLWGMGRGDGSIEQFIDPSVDLSPIEDQPDVARVRAGVYSNYWTQAAAQTEIR